MTNTPQQNARASVEWALYLSQRSEQIELLNPEAGRDFEVTLHNLVDLLNKNTLLTSWQFRDGLLYVHNTLVDHGSDTYDVLKPALLEVIWRQHVTAADQQGIELDVSDVVRVYDEAWLNEDRDEGLLS